MTSQIITFQGNPLHLQGNNTPRVGDVAPDFTVLKNDLTPASLHDYTGKGKVLVISSVPSLDTGVCNACTKRFNESLRGAQVLTISADLPFAQARWAAKEIPNSHHVECFSDHKDLDFATKYGLHIRELRLCARAVFVIDKTGHIRYAQVVPEMTDHPDYEAIYAAVAEANQ
ncbi:putative Thiol peroxidase [Paratrimastix pyriformis]|uniref:Thiol peroxidase n=1 Tax=Paratrimastix pyriformis TaxID=342808 RepID=A0ABQ8UNY7_9EUKA|nr:putative Thiol peroxidase [Paratrimastix pyriformis]